MGKAAGKGENTKKAAGNAKKAEAAAKKQDAENAKVAVVEDREWSKGAKSSAKKEDAEAKKVEAARKKAERDALLVEEEANTRSAPKNSKTAQKKTTGRGLDLSQLDDDAGNTKKSGAASALNASGIDNALDALALTSGGSGDTKVDRHPERRFKAAYAAFEARRLPEIDAENPGLRRQQRIELCRKEFEKHPDNPFNQVNTAFDASREEVVGIQKAERARVERLLSG